MLPFYFPPSRDGLDDDLSFFNPTCTTKAAEILEASMEAGLTLKEAEDIIFSNTRTMQFFNSVDLKQVRFELYIVHALLPRAVQVVVQQPHQF